MTKIDLRGTQLDLDCMLRDHPKQTFVYRPPAEPAPAPAADPATLTPDLDVLLGPSQPLSGRIKLTDVGPDWVDPNLPIGSKSDPKMGTKTEEPLEESQAPQAPLNQGQNRGSSGSSGSSIFGVDGRIKLEAPQAPQAPLKWDRGVRVHLGGIDVEKTVSSNVNDSGERLQIRVGRGSKALIHNVCKALDIGPTEFVRQAIIEMLCRYIE